MRAGAKTIYVGLDACDLNLAQQFAAEGSMPTLAKLLDTAAVQETLGPLGFLVGANWVTMYTASSPARHQFLCSGQVKGGTYEARWVGPYGNRAGDLAPVWKWVSDAGGRVAVLDAPHAAPTADLNGVQLVEWGCHDRHGPTCSSPPAFVRDVKERYGEHPLGSRTPPFPHHAPCDTSHRAATHRTVAENQALLADALEGLRRKSALSNDLLDEGGWDLFFTVFGESHCTGHQFWKVHDESHPAHDPDERRLLGGDPIRTVYGALDTALGELLARAGDANVYVHLSHAMRAHYDGTCVLDPVLWRLDEYASGTDLRGRFTRVADAAANVLPRSTRRRALTSMIDFRRRLVPTRGPIGTDGRPVEIPGYLGERRWWMQPNDSVFGSIRLNLEGREPDGRILATRKREVAEWLGARLLELVNADTGGPAVEAVHITDDHYERSDGDPLGDLIVEWNRETLIDTVWSPATGFVTAPYLQWRTGDHDRSGLLLASGPGITPGRRPTPISIMDVAPTLAASLGIDPPEIDGAARADLLPPDAAAKIERPARVWPRPLLSDRPLQPSGLRPYSRRAFDVPAPVWLQRYAVGLSRALHGTYSAVVDLRGDVDRVDTRVEDLERMASIGQATAWLRHVEVPESLLVSVVMPTRNRQDLLERAIESVRRQSYSNWELLVVDDDSTDDTATRLQKLAENDPRMRAFRSEPRGGSSKARNRALDEARGDVITYLDDDNRFDPDWLRSVAWAFTEYPETQVAYGARVVDDDVRHQGLSGRSMPLVQFLAWDRDLMLDSNRVDQNVIAHRRSSARFDDAIDHFSDWDLMLQLTTDCDPLELPAIAVHYYSDREDRVTAVARAAGVEPAVRERVLQRERLRRGGA